MRLIFHWLTLALGLFLVSMIRPLHISYARPGDLFWAALVIVIFNAVVKPVLIFITLPAVLLTLGFFLLVINALILYWTPVFVHGFHVPSFTSAFFGALLLSLITGVFSGWEKRSRRVAVPARRTGKIIDV